MERNPFNDPESLNLYVNRFIALCCRVRPIGSTSEGDTEYDRMKQVGVTCSDSFCTVQM